MPTEVRDRVSSLIDEAGRIERESETIYLALGRLFPLLSAEMARGADNGDSSLRALEALGGLAAQGAAADRRAGGPARSRGEPRGEPGGGRSFVERAAAFFDTLRERDSAFLARINDGISRLGSLEQIISRVRVDSEEMEIISLNALTVAFKSGAAGKAFSVITDELKRLSGKTIVLTEGVTATGRSLLDFFGSLRNALSELDGFQREFFSMMDQTLGSGYDEIRRDLSSATSFFGTLLEEARTVREPVLGVMGEIQLQDIVRQSLQHVGISLEEAREAAGAEVPGSPEEAAGVAFVAAVAELAEGLIEDVVGKLEASAASFGANMGAVTAIVGDSERKRLAFLEGGGSSGACADSGDFQSGSKRYLELKRDVAALASRLTDHVAVLDGSFKGLAALLSRFQNIVIASRIEVAKTRALAGVATTVGEMVTLTGRIEADVGAAMDTTKDFTRLASEAIGGYSAEGAAGSSEGERLFSTLRMVEDEIARLSSAKNSLRCAIDDFSLYTEEFISLIGSAGGELERLRALAARLRSVGSSLRALKASLEESLGPDSAGVEPERLRRMVERFTIFTHKKAAGAIGRFAVEEGSEAGEVTLF
jgi:hypothetical protein